MLPTVLTTPYGRPALRALRDAVAAAKAADALAPVTVVVPSNHAGVTARRLLAADSLGPVSSAGTGVAGVTFLTPYRLAELLGAPRLAATGRRPVSAPVIAAALRRALAVDPGIFAAVAEHPATETALVGAYAELSDLADSGLDALAAAGQRAHDVIDIVRRARSALSASWYDESHLTDAAVETVHGGGPVVVGLGTVVVHLPQDLLQRQARLLAAVAVHRPTTLVVGLTGTERADAGPMRSVGRLGVALPHEAANATARTAREPGTAAGSAAAAGALPVDAERTRIVTTSDADDEARVAVQGVVDAVREGTPLERIAVLFPTSRPYGRSLHEHFLAAGIPVNGTAVRPLAASLLGATLLDLLALPDHGYRRSDVLGLLTRSSLRGTDGRPAPTAAWERLSREAGVVRGRADWDRRLGHLADELHARVAALLAEADTASDAAEPDAAKVSDDERRRRRVDRLRRQARQARSLREVALGLVSSITAAAAGPRPWAEQVAWIREMAEQLVGGEWHAGSWPPDEERAADKVQAALDRLADLDTVDEPTSLAVFRRTLELELDADLGRVGRFGVGVLVAPLSFAVGLDVDLLIVVGMAEGSLPATVHDDSLLPDGERQRTDGEMPLRRERLERDHRHLIAALAGARHHLLCVPRGDLRVSNERVPSRWLVDVVEALTGERITADRVLDLAASWIHHVPSFAHAVRHAEFPPTEQHHRLRTGIARLDDPIATAGAEAIAARQSHAFTRFDGNLADAAVPSPLDGILSSTRLESWAVCPHAYLLRHLLGVEPVDDPEMQLAISPLDKGSLVHDVLDRFIHRVLDRPPDDQPAPDQPWNKDDRQLMHAIATQVCDEYEAQGRTGRPVFWHRDRAQLLALAQRFLDEDEAVRRDEHRRLVASEMRFGLGGAVGPVELALPDGRTARFRGSADRVDVADDGTLHVIDYKTGKADSYRGLDAVNPDARGTRLQLAVYGLAARLATARPDAPVAAHYWFVSERGRFQRIGYVVDAPVLRHVSSAVATVIDGIASGVFPARPTDDGGPFITCPYCDPDGLGVADLRRDWERKRDDPALAPYANFAEPRADDDQAVTP